MAFVLPNSVLLHCPKTAGTWISSVLADAGMIVTSLPKHINCEQIPDEYAKRFCFTFVRHPLTWFQSYFAHKMTNGWSNDDIDRHCRSSDFRQFLTNCLDRFPQGYCSTVLYSRYFENANFVGLFERLKPDLIRALDLAGEEFDGSIFHSTPPKNVSKYDLIDISYTPDLRERILKAEKVIIERFYR